MNMFMKEDAPGRPARAGVPAGATRPIAGPRGDRAGGAAGALGMRLVAPLPGPGARIPAPGALPEAE